MAEQKILTTRCLLDYLGKVSADNGLPFKYVGTDKPELIYTGKDNVEDAILDLHEAVFFDKPNVAAQLPYLEEICPQYASYLDETDEFRTNLVCQGALREDGLTLTEKGYDLLKSKVNVGAVCGIGLSIPLQIGTYLKVKLESMGIDTERRRLKAVLAAAVVVGAGIGGALLAKNVHADSRGLEKDWYEKSPATHPSPRQGAVMSNVYEDGRAILFGGADANGTDRYNDTWAYNEIGNIWEQKNPAQSPSVREYSSMASVYGSSKIVLFGGWDGSEQKDTWVYDLKNDTWTNMSPQQSPQARDSAAMASVYGEDKVVLFGGASSGVYPYDCLGDTWIYDLSDNAWAPGPSGPPARNMHAMAGIYGADQVLMFGGANGGNTFGDTWVYDLSDSQWLQKTAAQSPVARAGHAMAGIYGDDKAVLFGGVNKITETWVYDLSDGAWTQKPTTYYPAHRNHHSMSGFYGKDDIVLFGGLDERGGVYGDTWIYGKQIAPPQNPNEFVVVTADLHIGAPNANKTLEDFVTQVNSMNPKPACVVVAGDVSDYGGDGDPSHKGSNNLQEAKAILDRLNVPYYVEPGNHDARNWKAPFDSMPGNGDNFKDYKAIMPAPSNSDNYKIDLDKLTIFCLNSGTDNLTSIVGDPLLPESTGVTDSQINWLESALKSTPTENQRVLVMHNPITADQDGSVSNNYASLLKLCVQYKVTVVGGHTHQLKSETVAGVSCWQMPSLAHQRAYELVSFKDNKPVFSHRVLQQSTGIESHSPVDVQIIDSGKASGISNGNLKQGLPGTTFIRNDYAISNPKDSVEYLSVDGVHKKFSVQCLEDGIYKVRVNVNDDSNKTIEISAKARKGQLDVYEVQDWSAVAKGKQGSIKVSRDVNGDGHPEKVFSSDSNITESDFDNAKPVQHSGQTSWQQMSGGAIGLVAAIGAGFALLRKRKPKLN